MPVARSRLFIRHALIWTVVLGFAGTVLAARIGGSGLAWGVALGALAGGLNLAAMADEIARVLEQVAGTNPSAGPPRRPLTRLRWPALLLALILILWYTPARPEGVAGGILLVLGAATIAGLLTHRTETSPGTPASPPPPD